jgi:hypothetical protein
MSTALRSVPGVSTPATPTHDRAGPGAGHADRSAGAVRLATLAAGLGLLVLAILTPIANFGILKTLVVSGDAAATAHNISANDGLFRLGIGAFFVVAVVDMVVAWALNDVFRSVSRNLSSLGALLRVAYAVVLAVSVNHLLTASQLAGGAGFLGAIGTDQLHAQTMVSVGAFQSGWDLALIVFGLHLLVEGAVVFRASKRLRVLGVFLAAAGLGYVVDGAGKMLSPDYSLTVAVFTFVGEPMLMVWLLWKGFKGGDTARGKAVEAFA